MEPPRPLSDFSLDHFSLAGRAALVTGGNTGLGQAFTVALARAGADVFVPSLLGDDGGTRALVESAGRRMVEIRVDLTETGAPARAVHACVEELGGIDVLVNSAGICLQGPWEQFGREHWDPMVAVNLTTAYELTHEAAGHMVARGRGKIVNVASVYSFLGGRTSPAYAATKHGVLGLTRAYCDELAEHNVQVNAIAPGYFATALTEATRSDPTANRRVIDRVPAGRWGDPADLMGAVVFLASRASDYVNGQVLTVDGGYLVR